ncbi:MAG: hypothetical protein PHQ78_07480 [Candidatus Cloacimonetes bacterium]|jgi:hypothetical protein|nr:OprO/OprP family phosphate-selective porin [Candidatus Cloacimonadota bacterium]MDD2507134.1 hypothetical protein [Candidatus Cloacimonadota bacterium]MDD4560651.1 hypothetical protein [Candidatus Cloacimonadota bacterium]
MKHWVYKSLVLALLMILPLAAMAAESTLSTELWGRWTMTTGTSAADRRTITKANAMALERGYVDLKTKFSENTSARFTVDVFSTDDQKNGAGLKLKYAFLDFGNLIPIQDLKLSVGLQKVFFGSIYDWDYNLIGKAPVDEYKLVNSADYGVSINGYLPSGWGEYAIGMYNGEGYKNYGANLKGNTRFEGLANLRLTPLAGLTLGASVMTNSVEREYDIDTDIPVPGYQNQFLADVLARFVVGPLDVMAEYFSKNVEYPNIEDGSKDYNASGISIIPIFNLRNYIDQDIQILGRYDRWDATDNASDKHLSNALTAGINYNFMHNDSYVPSMQLQLNATHKSYDEDNSAPIYANELKDSFTLMAQLKWRFSHAL